MELIEDYKDEQGRIKPFIYDLNMDYYEEVLSERDYEYFLDSDFLEEHTLLNANTYLSKRERREFFTWKLGRKVPLIDLDRKYLLEDNLYITQEEYDGIGQYVRDSLKVENGSMSI